MKEKILIVEDQFVEADYLRLMLTKAGYRVCAIARSVPEAMVILQQENPKLVLLDIFLKGKLTGIDLARHLKEKGIAFIFLSANSNEEILTAAKATEPYGFLVKPFREKDLLVSLEIAQYRNEHSIESRLLKEEILQNQLATIINEKESWEQKLMKLGRILQPYIPFDYLAAGFNTLDQNPCHALGFLRIGFDEYQTIGVQELCNITGLSKQEIDNLHALSVVDKKPAIFNDAEFQNAIHTASIKRLFATTFDLQSHLLLTLQLSNGEFFNFCFYSRRSDTYQTEHIDLFNRLENVWTRSIETLFLQQKKSPFLTMLQPGKYAGDEKYPVAAFNGIIGTSHLLLNVFDNISMVAGTDTSVLILGESGTGKERIADCIHKLSSQNGKPFIKVNCASLPPSLIESELFGHEKGAFTGANDKRIGKFEQADQGTIFLDEIGELPLELQGKFLRVLQEKEVERVGARATIKINVRIIAATNRNLEKEVAEGRFRLDLYYRLNVFPILLPALRERKEDIPALATHFINCYNRKTGKKVMGISEKVLKKFTAYDWPGNIRELEHLIERNILLAKGTHIEDINLPSFTIASAAETRIKTNEENERDHILLVLKKCNGRIWGAGAAAEILNLPPTTLKSKMKKLGIKKAYIQ
ncbi:MAG: sigma 54-interacting transcriptional regulator [Chitinophagaceae bacterium]